MVMGSFFYGMVKSVLLKKGLRVIGSTICKSGPFVSAEGCKYQSVHLYPEIKVLMIELNVFYEKILFLTVYCNIPN